MDDELQQIRARRLAQLQAAQGGNGGGNSGVGGMAGIPSGMGEMQGQGDRAAMAEKQRNMEEQRQNMLYSILESAARERLATVKIVNAQKGKSVEDMLIYQVRSGQRRSKVSEAELISILEQIDESQRPKTTITIQRRNSSLSDDDDDDW